MSSPFAVIGQSRLTRLYIDGGEACDSVTGICDSHATPLRLRRSEPVVACDSDLRLSHSEDAIFIIESRFDLYLGDSWAVTRDEPLESLGGNLLHRRMTDTVWSSTE
ncbi:hypothetical protein GCM10017668_53070 [Streptomyces tuirus]|uniref:Uncharacterized protein n=1 Tax=Streptomyces tuirus TaxID=68278 RepID=A0A7G1NP16_9ACTN|nr:hypothetical protein GCM10017668_53070 [Streptomyces tuirus]